MSPEFDPFLEAILTQPDLRTPRLVFADYLEEQGDPRATFLRWSVQVWEQATALTVPAKGCRDLNLYALQAQPAKLRIFACLCVRLTPWTTITLLGIRTRVELVWDWLSPGARSTVAAAELFAAELFTVNRLRRALRDVRPLPAQPPSASREQSLNAAANAVRYAAAEAAETLSLAATSTLNALSFAWLEDKAKDVPTKMAQARAFQQTLASLVAQTPVE
jgi:uncharacterized protein (TIGR02996 family)